MDLFCESAIMLVTKEACCNNTLEPPGVAFTVPAEEGCNLCPISELSITKINTDSILATLTLINKINQPLPTLCCNQICSTLLLLM